MISEGGHAVIGEFSAASMLPILGQTGGGDSFERPRSLSCVEEDGLIYRSIILRPEDTVAFSPLYAAPELLEKKENGLLIFDERADWWSLGISLYEIITDGTPSHISSDAISIRKGRRDDGESGMVFDLLEGLDLMGSTTCACNPHLDGYLRSVNPFFELHLSILKTHIIILSRSSLFMIPVIGFQAKERSHIHFWNH